MNLLELISLGAVAGLSAGMLAGLVGIGGGVVIVPVVYHALGFAGVPANEAAHVAVATSLASIVPASLVSFLRHLKSGHADLAFLREWGPGIAVGVVVAQFSAPFLDGRALAAVFACLCLLFAYRFAFPEQFAPMGGVPAGPSFRHLSSLAIGVCSGLAGVGGGILTNIVMTLSGLPMHKSIGRAAAAGVVVSIPATLVAALATQSTVFTQIGSIDWAIWLCIAPAQALGAWVGAGVAAHTSPRALSRVFSVVLVVTGFTMLRSVLSP
ncbi:MAG: sulfite exporter TauE/SafE family protein [Alphaproteobacteria bacterium]|nr:sulfite exporter TauE/SafE family protein [Alphaproteobacteria bacterium]